MTSKNLFFKLIVQDFKYRIWCPIILFLAYFVSMEIQLINQFDQMQRRPSNYQYAADHYLANIFFSPMQNGFKTYMTVAVAVLCALSGFAYLHSRKQLDTFHSMPVKRETLFGARYVSGLLMFAIPFALHTVFCLGIAATNKALSVHGIVNAVGFFGIQILFFLLIYSLCIVVVCLTGNMIISVLGSCVLVGYSQIIALLKEALYDTFFYTYLGSYGNDVWAFSPIGMLGRIFEIEAEYRELNSGLSYRCLVPYSFVLLAAILAFTILGLVLYKKRATEAAGKPIAFKITEPFIKTIVVLPFSLFCGFIFRDMFNRDSFGWFAFGVAFGFIVSALVMEIIFRLDVRCAFHHWKQLIFNGVCLVLIVVVFRYDVLGYNTYVPNAQELSGCAISFSGLMNIRQMLRTEQRGYEYVNSTDYRFDHMNIADNPSALALVQKAASEGLRHEEYEFFEGIEDTPEYQERRKKEELYRPVSVKLTKTNGKNVYRSYYIDLADEETVSLLADIFKDSDYKLGSFPILTNAWKKEYSVVGCTSADFYDSVMLSPERQAALFQAYQSDLLKLTLEEVMNTVPLGNIDFTLKGYTKNIHGGTEEGYKVYPSFTTTIELLKEYGFDYTKKLTAEEVDKIEVDRYYDSLDEQVTVSYELTYEERVVSTPAYDSEITLEYKDKESIESILQAVVNEELLEGVTYCYLREYDGSDDVVIYFNNEGIEEAGRYQFFTELKPEFIDKDFGIKAEEVKKEQELQK